MAVIAQGEAKMISQRTKAALKAAKARGVKLGNPSNLTHKARQRGNGASHALRADRALQRAQDVAPTIMEIQSQGATSLRQIARDLNSRGIPAPRRGDWSAVQVKRVLSRLNDAA
jgi:DNA invertase Pin-like site-specific DNA recombinase